MQNTPAITTGLPQGALQDARALDPLRMQAQKDPKQALKGVSQQFEALFLQQLMKTMRDASPKDGLMDSEQTRSYTAMLDQQMATHLSKRGVGLADALYRQLMQSAVNEAAQAGQGPAGDQPDPFQVSALEAARPAASPQAAVTVEFRNADYSASPGAPAGMQDAFVQRVKGPARAASAATGIPAEFLIGQAALESGWGKREIRGADGSNSHNLFGIKAGAGWTGRTVDVLTTEFEGGVARKMVQKFRAYDSYADSFADHARLISGNRRYAAVLGQTQVHAFAQGLQRAGYATDPQYADKLVRVIGGTRLRNGITT